MDLCLCSGEQRSRFTRAALSAGVTGNSRRAFVKTHPPKYSIGIPSTSNVWSKIRKPPWASDFFRQFLRVIFKSDLGILFNNLHESHRTISKHFNMNLIGSPRMIIFTNLDGVLEHSVIQLTEGEAEAAADLGQADRELTNCRPIMFTSASLQLLRVLSHMVW